MEFPLVGILVHLKVGVLECYNSCSIGIIISMYIKSLVDQL